MRFYKYIQALSLDIVAGACIGTLYIAHIMQTTLSYISIMALGISVWLIYTADHLWDAQKNKYPSTFRHLFHQKYFNTLVKLWLLVALGGVVTLFYVPVTTLQIGSVVAILVAVYFILLYRYGRSLWLYKELMISTVYTAGIFAEPFSSLFDASLLSVLYLFSVYFFLAVTNVLIFSVYDEVEDRRDGHNSIVMRFGSSNVLLITKLCWGIGVVLSVSNNWLSAVDYLTLFMMYGVLGVVIFARSKLKFDDRYRVLGDGIFMIPIIPLLYS